MQLLQLVQLETLANRYPHQLSGGQRQRVALARALAIEPKVLLLDEPFGALDAKVRQELRRWLRRLHDEIHVTSVFVTHDQDEALELADRVVVMNEGRIEQIGTPDEVFHSPATEFVMNFLGQVNLFRGRVEDGKVHFATLALESPEHARNAGPAGPGLRPPARFRGRHAPQRATVRSGRRCAASIRPARTCGWSWWPSRASGSAAEIPQDRFRSRGIVPGSVVFLTPRDVKVFADDDRGPAAEEPAA